MYQRLRLALAHNTSDHALRPMLHRQLQDVPKDLMDETKFKRNSKEARRHQSHIGPPQQCVHLIFTANRLWVPTSSHPT